MLRPTKSASIVVAPLESLTTPPKQIRGIVSTPPITNPSRSIEKEFENREPKQVAHDIASSSNRSKTLFGEVQIQVYIYSSQISYLIHFTRKRKTHARNRQIYHASENSFSFKLYSFRIIRSKCPKLIKRINHASRLKPWYFELRKNVKSCISFKTSHFIHIYSHLVQNLILSTYLDKWSENVSS